MQLDCINAPENKVIYCAHQVTLASCHIEYVLLNTETTLWRRLCSANGHDSYDT